MKNIIIALSTVLIILSSCSQEKQSPLLNKKVEQDNLLQLMDQLAADNVLDVGDLKDFRSGIALLGQANDSVYGKTVGDIIKFKRERSRTNEVNELKNLANKAKINMTLKFDVRSINPLDNDQNQINVVQYQIMNKTDQDIKRVKGFVNIVTKDQKQDVIKQLPVEITDVVPANKGLAKNYPYKHDSRNQRDVILRTQQNNIQALWYPLEIELADGTIYKATY